MKINWNLMIIAIIVNIGICSYSIYKTNQLKSYSKQILNQIERHQNEVIYFDKEVGYFLDKVEFFSTKVDTLNLYLK